MSKEMIVRAWKDPEFRARLDADDVPASPVGDAEPAIAELEADAYISSPVCTIGPVCTKTPCG